ncbi:MAG: UDP-2,3-diacylglucosamine diphosphatase [Deltaproteobacteria bacterium]|uniref:UDP-2,3-diacylglucosamine diphosphatase n=1 Tax=Candidatus Zymogenus saltonus TaxID=2844893 RepID=A0A9D8KC77_9DELT|nr:UDP-2,3-diacylglucosamine diphosphatase [Candidatus Zymogenus saltonus]
MTSKSGKTYFITDSHLTSPDDENYSALLFFLDVLKAEREATPGPLILVILGDLFDFWVGYRSLVPKRYEKVIDRLFDLSRNGVDIRYTEGNHDFFMGPIFTDRIGASVYSRPWDMETQGLRIYIAHGDQVNRKDYGYRLLRCFLRNPLFRIIRRCTPNFVIEMIAKKMSRASRAYTERKEDDHEEIAWEFANVRFREGYDAVVIGHFHERKLKRTDLSGRERLYVNVGLWMDGDYDYVILEGGKFKPMKFDYRPVRKK